MKPIKKMHLQKGISLLESLVAIIVLSLGLLGILGAQMRTLTNTQDSARRLQAIRLIEDLSERIKVQPDAIGQASLYVTDDWIDTTHNLEEVLPDTADCLNTACTPVEFAHFDKKRWIENIAQSLPLAQLNVFPTSDSKQLGVMLAWRSNENNITAASELLPPPAANAEVACPDDRTCHLQYISLNQRCIPIDAEKAYCPEQ